MLWWYLIGEMVKFLWFWLKFAFSWLKLTQESNIGTNLLLDTNSKLELWKEILEKIDKCFKYASWFF